LARLRAQRVMRRLIRKIGAAKVNKTQVKVLVKAIGKKNMGRKAMRKLTKKMVKIVAKANKKAKLVKKAAAKKIVKCGNQNAVLVSRIVRNVMRKLMLNAKI